MTHQLVMWALLRRISSIPMALQFAIVCGVVLVLSLLLFRVVEKPARDRVKAWVRGRRRMSEPLAIPAVLAPADEMAKQA